MQTDYSTSQETIKLWQQLKQTPVLLADIDSASGSALQRQQKLRESYPAELVRLGLDLHDLRLRAGDKFSQADRMWFTRQSLEQTSSESLAEYKARRFQSKLDSIETIQDLCTGVGADAIALSEVAPVITYDLDPVMLQLALWNAEVYERESQITFQQQDVNELDVRGRVIHIDPDQRDAQGKRHRRLESIQPPLEVLQRMSQECYAGAIKLSPASNFGGKFPDCETELISWQGECKQAVIWCGELAEPGLWRATVLPSGESLVGDPLEAYPEFSEVSNFVYDPDPAVVRAGMINQLSEQLGVARLDDAEEYLTSEERIDSPFLSGFQVIETLTRNETQLRKYLRKLDVGEVEIKCRHLRIDIEKVRKSLPLSGTKAITLIFARVGGKSKVIVCSRLTS
ncbi:MAG TPA: hypothetical protein DD473_24705 [Planctomycetaceae bacterium]|nr:hypothetical protein [Planctomycetaceae bacterium]